ncbi:MAG: translation elongation factor Ts [Lachnospiraceae bacterium]|nr:translation elongation factor Ts [Lachnospiraceae bacterium]
MAITAAMVKELRETSGAGMMECKKALTETDGDMEAAIEVLKKSGAMKAVKKASRIAAEGVARAAICGNTAAVVEVNSETDFVAKNEKFTTFVEAVANQALNTAAADMDAFLAEAWAADTSKTVNDVLTEQIAVIGEKLSIRRFEKVSGEVVTSYIHGGGKIGVLVAGEGASDDAAKEALTNVAMQIAAMSPQYVSQNDISADELAKMKEITIDSALNDPASLPKPILMALFAKVEADKLFSDADAAILAEKKNDKYLFNFLSDEAKAKLAELAMADKAKYVEDKIFVGLVDGRIKKQVKEISLLEQTYVKAEDGKQTVAQYLATVNKALVITKMVRFEVGEGMEKKNENFAEEVAKQMGN